MKLFRTDNTEGFTQEEMDALNQEWAERVDEMGLGEHTDEYNIQASAFGDEVARR